MQFFKTADPTRRTPTYLQAHTKDNLVFQLALLPFVLLGVHLWYKWADRKLDKQMETLSTDPTD